MMAKPFTMDDGMIRKAVNALHPGGEIFEVRLIDGKWNMAGVFNNPDRLIEALKAVRNRIRPGANAYITLNRLHEACYARKHRDTFVEYASPTAGDRDVTAYNWLLIDVDPVRPSGTSSTNEQLGGSRETAKRIRDYLRECGWPAPHPGPQRQRNPLDLQP